MIQVRQNIFETNSSSTHAICVHKDSTTEDWDHYFSLWTYDTCFGRQDSLVDRVPDKIAYVYIMVKMISQHLGDGGEEIFLNNLYNIFQKHYDIDEFKKAQSPKQILTDFLCDIDDEYNAGRAGIDHVQAFEDNGLYERIKTDKDFLERLIFDENSYITTGSDESRGYNFKKIGFEYDYENYEDFWKKVEDLKHNFEIYLKGN